MNRQQCFLRDRGTVLGERGDVSEQLVPVPQERVVIEFEATLVLGERGA